MLGYQMPEAVNHGSITDTSNLTGVQQTRTSYEPYGTPTTTKLDPNALDTRLGYTGEYHDPRLGLIHLRARDYDTAQSRFTAEDPQAAAIQYPFMAAYIYANDRPTVYIDPSGQMGTCQGPEGCSGLGGPGGNSSGGNSSLGGNVSGGLSGAYSSLMQELNRTFFLGREAESVFTRTGCLKPEIIQSSKRIIEGPDLHAALRRDLVEYGGRIEDWGKYTTQTVQSPAGPFQVHFYYNPVTGQAYYLRDYKVKFNVTR
ncbi:hypothetical protein GCM10027569_09330 [Flindersiella endophytica]